VAPPDRHAPAFAGTTWILIVCAGLLFAGEAAGLWAQAEKDLDGFIAIALFQGAVYAGAALAMLRGRRTLALILAVAALLRLGALGAPVFLSDDVDRYIWDGRVQAHGINPYRYIPNDPHLAGLRDEVFWHINRGNYAPTIYPPVAQMLFFLATRFGESGLAVKFVLTAVEALGIWGLLCVLRAARAPPEHVLLYAWHPLPVWEIAGSGHVDAAVVAFVALALAAAATGRRGWSGAALAAATLVKYFPVVLAPALWRPGRDWRFPAAFAAVAATAYLPYLGVGPRVFGFLGGYVKEEQLVSGSGVWLLDALRPAIALPSWVYFAGTATLMAGLAIAALRRGASSFGWAAALGTAATLLASPHYPWYFVWVVALLCVAPWWPALWPTLAAPLLYWDAHTGHIPMWVGFTLYGGFAILALGDLARRGLYGRRHAGS
jgi:alpha-1,6-mannosyltransferase